MSRNGNAAYDFDRFSPQEQQNTAKVIPLPVEHREPQPQRQSPLKFLKYLLICAVCVGMFGSLVYNELTLNELNTNIQKTTLMLERAQSEYVQLEMAAASRLTLEEIERYAVDVLGMQKLQNNQLQYIRMSDRDKIEVLTTQEPSWWDHITEWVSGLFG